MKPSGIVEKGEVVLFSTVTSGYWTIRVMGYPNLVWENVPSEKAIEILEELEEFRK